MPPQLRSALASDRARWHGLLACFVLSGAAGLIYQTAWMQQLSLVFGASDLAVSSVLAAYMGGLTAGALLAGRWLRKVSRPLYAYALLEVAIALSALAVPGLLYLAADLRAWLFAGDNLESTGGPGSGLFYLLCTFGVLAVPTLCLGATLPFLSRWAIRSDQQLGPRIAGLYGANTLGAAAGALASSFWLLPGFGLGLTVWVAIGLNLAVALAALALARTRTSSAMSAPPPAAADRALERGWILPVLSLSGFIAFGWEVLWTRLLAHLLGGSLYAYGWMLAVFLAGIGAGSALAGTWARSSARARLAFIWAQLGIAVTSWGAFYALDPLARLLEPNAARLPQTALLAALVLFPGALMMGATFPCAVRLRAGRAEEAGTASAQVYAWNTLGAILGAVSVGFLLLPLLRFDGVAATLIAGSLVLAVASSWALGLRALIVVGACALLLLSLRPPTTPWHTLRTAPISGKVASGEVSFYAVGRSSTVLLYRDGRNHRLATNGLPESLIQPPGARPSRLATAYWLSLLPVAARPEARSMLIVGLGAGHTVNSVPPSVEHIDVVELEPEVVAANRVLAPDRERDPLADPRVRVHLDDARSALQLSRERYDVVVSQPSHPWTAAASHLFTREFFALAHQRLADDGVFLQWIGRPFVDPPLVRSLVATLGDVFPFVEVYAPGSGGAFLFLAGSSPVELSPDGFAQGRSFWRELGVLELGDLHLTRLLDAEGSRAFGAGARLTTDRRNLLQIRSPRVLSEARPLRTAQLFTDHDPLREGMSGDQAATRVRRLLDLGQVERARLLSEAIGEESSRLTARGLLALRAGNRPEGLALLQQALVLEPTAHTPASHEALMALLLLNRQGLIRGTHPRLTERVERCCPEATAVLEGWRQLALDHPDRVRALEAELATIKPDHPLFSAAILLRARWRLHADLDHAREALELVEPAIGSSPNRAGLLIERVLLAVVAAELEVLEDAIEDLGRHRPAVIRQGLRELSRLGTDHSLKARAATELSRRLEEALEPNAIGGSALPVVPIAPGSSR